MVHGDSRFNNPYSYSMNIKKKQLVSNEQLEHLKLLFRLQKTPHIFSLKKITCEQKKRIHSSAGTVVEARKGQLSEAIFCNDLLGRGNVFNTQQSWGSNASRRGGEGEFFNGQFFSKFWVWGGNLNRGLPKLKFPFSK